MMELVQLKLGISFTNNTCDFNSPETITLQSLELCRNKDIRKIFKGVAELHSSSSFLGHPSAAATNSARKHYYECRTRTRTRATAWFVNRGHSAPVIPPLQNKHVYYACSCPTSGCVPESGIRTQMYLARFRLQMVTAPPGSHQPFFRWLYIAKMLYILKIKSAEIMCFLGVSIAIIRPKFKKYRHIYI
jgi:hypothetical protein